MQRLNIMHRLGLLSSSAALATTAHSNSGSGTQQRDYLDQGNTEDGAGITSKVTNYLRTAGHSIGRGVDQLIIAPVTNFISSLDLGRQPVLAYTGARSARIHPRH